MIYRLCLMGFMIAVRFGSIFCSDVCSACRFSTVYCETAGLSSMKRNVIENSIHHKKLWFVAQNIAVGGKNLFWTDLLGGGLGIFVHQQSTVWQQAEQTV